MALIDIDYLVDEGLYDDQQPSILCWMPIQRQEGKPTICLVDGCIEAPTQEAAVDLPDEYAARSGARVYVLLTVACDAHAERKIRPKNEGS